MNTRPSPIRLILILAASIFIAEGIVMALLLALPPLPSGVYIILDPILLIIFLSPILYLFLLRPLLRLIAEIKGAEERLRGEQGGLKRLLDEKRAVENELKKSEERYRLVHDNAFDAIILACAEDKVLDCNPSAEKMFGYGNGEMIGLEITRLMPDQYRDAHSVGLKRFLSTGETNILGKVVEVQGIKKDSTLFPVELVITSFSIDNTTCFTGTIRDITERKKAEKEKEIIQARLSQSQKMEAIGRLSSGLSHDFNNVLTNIQGNVELVMDDMDPTQPAYQRLVSIMNSIRHATTLTRHLSLISRSLPVELKRLNLNLLAQAILPMIKNIVGPEITISTGFSPSLSDCMADAACIEEVIMNLAVIAREAMPEGGGFSIKTEDVEVKRQDFPDTPDAYPCRAICVTIADTGIGMDSVALEHVFEPFSPGKRHGEAVGFGLAVAYGIIKKHKGWIKVESTEGEGTTFKVYLPAIEAP